MRVDRWTIRVGPLTRTIFRRFVDFNRPSNGHVDVRSFTPGISVVTENGFGPLIRSINSIVRPADKREIGLDSSNEAEWIFSTFVTVGFSANRPLLDRPFSLPNNT